MKSAHIKEVRQLAKDLIFKCEAALTEMQDQTTYSHRASAALRRASMELTHALAAMRSNGRRGSR